MYLERRYLKELDRIDGEQMEFGWKNFPGFTALGILSEIQKMMAELKCEPEQFQGRIIFMSMFNDLTRRSPDNCVANSVNVSRHKPSGEWNGVYISSHQSFGKRRIEKQRWWKENSQQQK